MQVDVDAVDFGLVAFGFRYAKEFTLHNTCAIPMQYAWRVPKDSLDPAHKEFTVGYVACPLYLHSQRLTSPSRVCVAGSVCLSATSWWPQQAMAADVHCTSSPRHQRL